MFFPSGPKVGPGVCVFLTCELLWIKANVNAFSLFDIIVIEDKVTRLIVTLLMLPKRVKKVKHFEVQDLDHC